MLTRLVQQESWIRVAAFLCLLVACWLTAPDMGQLDARVSSYTNMETWDPGAQLLFSAYRYVILEGKTATGRDVLAFELGIVAVFSAVSLLARVPIIVALGSQASLFSIWLVFHSVKYVRAGESWAVVLAAGFLTCLVFWRGEKWDYFTLLAYGTVLGYLPLIRKSAHLVVLLPPIAVMGFTFLSGCGLYFSNQRAARWRKAGIMRLFLAPLLFCVWVVIVQHAALQAWTATQPVPFREHGTGNPLLMSLGYSKNPYNLAWDDDVSMARGLLLEKTPWTWHGAEAATWQHRRVELWLHYILEDPMVVLRAMLARTDYLSRFFSGTADLQVIRADGNPAQPSWITTLLGVGFLGAVGLIGWWSFRARGRRMVTLFAGSLGLFLGGLGSLVMIAPFYLGSAIAYCVAFILVLAPAAWICVSQERRSKDTTWEVAGTIAYKIFLIVLTCIVLVVTGYTGWRSVVNRAQARVLMDGNLKTQVQELGIDYAHRFNRLSLREQRNILRRLLDSEREVLVYRGTSRPDSVTEGHVFAPILAFLHDEVAYVAVWMSRDWEMTLPSRIQGPRNSMIQLLRNTSDGPRKVRYFDAPWSHLKIADANWDDSYRMLCFPQLYSKSLERFAGERPAELGKPVKFFHVAAFNFGGGSHMSGLSLLQVGEGRLEMPEKADRQGMNRSRPDNI